MDQPLISIVVPIYNSAKTIKKCVQSILNQSYKNFELLLIDDGSKDNSFVLCQSMAMMDSRIKVYHQENGGVSSARNYGIRVATGDYICFVDSDDWVDGDYLDILASHMEKGGLTACQLNEGKQRNDKALFVEYTPGQAQISVMDCHGMQGFPWNKLFDLDLIHKNQVYFNRNITICEDVLFCVQYLRHMTGLIYYTDKQPYHYNKTVGGATNSRFVFHVNLNPQDLTEVAALQECKQFLLNDPKINRAWKTRYIKAAVNTLRTLEAHRIRNHKLYAILLRHIRKYWFSYVKSPYGQLSSKISVCLSAIAPWLELYVWRRLN